MHLRYTLLRILFFTPKSTLLGRRIWILGIRFYETLVYVFTKNRRPTSEGLITLSPAMHLRYPSGYLGGYPMSYCLCERSCTSCERSCTSCDISRHHSPSFRMVRQHGTSPDIQADFVPDCLAVSGVLNKVHVPGPIFRRQRGGIAAPANVIH